MLKNQIVTTVY